jgi:RNA polymerase sigma-70 factor, ECF subfamily
MPEILKSAEIASKSHNNSDMRLPVKTTFASISVRSEKNHSENPLLQSAAHLRERTPRNFGVRCVFQHWMETLELGRMEPVIPSMMQPADRSRSNDRSRSTQDRAKENAEDLALFREFLAGRAASEDRDAGVRSKGNRESREAFTKIYLRYRERVYAYALRVLANEQDAEDLFQEVFFRVYSRAESFTEEKSPGGWIFTIAHNLCLNKVRDRKPQDNLDDLALPVEHGTYGAPTDLGEDGREVIARAMALLPIEYREVIILREYEGMSYAEITEILHTTIPSIKSRLYRAKGKLREILAPYYKENYR